MLKQKKKRKKIHQHKKPSSIKNIDFDKMVVSNNVSFGKKKQKIQIFHWLQECYAYFFQK